MNYFEIIKKVAVCPGINMKEPKTFDTIDPQMRKIKNAVNQALKSVCSCWEWKFRTRQAVFNSEPQVGEYPGVSGKIIRVNFEKDQGSSLELQYEPGSCSDKLYGTPYSYSWEFGKILLFPIPFENKKVTVTYLTDRYAVSFDGGTEKGELELETDVPIIPEKFQDLIVHKALMNFFATPTKKEYPYYLAQFCERLNQAKLEDRGPQDNTPHIEISGRSRFSKRFNR